MRLKVSHIPLFGEKRDTRFRSLSGAEACLNHYQKALNNARKNSNYEEVQRMKSMLLAVDFAPIIAPVLEVLNALLWPCIAIVGAVGTIYCIFLGIKIAKSDEQNSREKAKKDLIGAIIGFLIIFILMVALKIAMPILEEWVKSQIT